MRLIDADEFKEFILTYGKAGYRALPIEKISGLIDSQSTSYDVDKVVEQMEKDTELAYNRYMDCSPNAPQSVVARYSTQYQERKRCLDIIKSGGID